MSQIITQGYGPGGSSSGPINLVSIAATADFTVVLTFDVPPQPLAYAAIATNWLVSGLYQVYVTGIAVAGNTLVLTTTPMTNGAPYQLTVPPIVSTPTGGAYTGSSTLSFTGFGSGPSIQVNEINCRLIEVTFLSIIEQTDALRLSNYSFTGSLQAEAVQRVDDQNFLVTTSRALPTVSHTVTAAVRDVAGNLHTGGGSSSTFTGAILQIEDIFELTPTRIRVQFTQDVLRVSPSGAHDALNPFNYSLTSGPYIRPISTVQAVGNDPAAVDLIFANNLPVGDYTVSAVNITTPEGYPII